MPALKVNTPQVQALIVLLYWDSMQKKNLINANISVNEQSEWFHWAHRRWPFYTYLRHEHVLDHGHFTDVVSALAIWITVSPVISKKTSDRWNRENKELGFIS